MWKDQKNSSLELKFGSFASGLAEVNLHSLRKTKILCTITSTSSRELIWKLAKAGMNVAHLNMLHGDHSLHQKTIDLVNLKTRLLL